MISAILFAILLGSLGSKRISWLIVIFTISSLILSIPIAFLYSYLNIHPIWSFLICIFIVLIYLFFTIDFPMTVDLRNKEYIEQIIFRNEALETFQSFNEKNESLMAHIGDGLPEVIPKKITKSKEICNRILYFFKVYIKHYLDLVKNYFKWTFGSHGDLNFYEKIYGGPSTIGLKYAKSDEICEDIKKIIFNTELNGGTGFRLFAAVGLFYLILYFILEDLNEWNWISFFCSTVLFIVFGVLFKKILWRYVGGINANINLLKKYQEKLFSDRKFIGLAINKDINSYDWQNKIILKVLDYSPKDIEEGLIQKSNNVCYLIIEPNHSFKNLLMLLSVIKDEKRFQRWLKIFCSKDDD